MRRGTLIAAAALLAVAGVLGLILFFSARDDATLGETSAPGRPAPDATSAELRRGNVVVRFADPAQEAPLRDLAREFGPASLAGAGQAVLVRRDPQAGGVVADAWRRRQRASGPGDPELRAFIEHWLGRGAGG